MRRGPRRLMIALLVVAALVLGLTIALFVFPPVDEPGRADAVVVFAGAAGERQEAGIRLIREGVAPVLVISDGGLPGSPSARVCRERLAGLRLVCLTQTPQPPVARRGPSRTSPGGRAGARWPW
jgi:hypothetical protein